MTVCMLNPVLLFEQIAEKSHYQPAINFFLLETVDTASGTC